MDMVARQRSENHEPLALEEAASANASAELAELAVEALRE